MSEALSKREQMREERRRQILESALTVFSQKGFHAANVSDVAAHAGVSQGTIYWYFSSKEELFDAAIMAYIAGFGTEMATMLQGGESASERLCSLAQSMAQLVAGVQQVFVAFLSYWASSQEQQESRQFWVDMLHEYTGGIVAIIEEGIRSGEFKQVDARAWEP
ncbi:MAG: TetR/AcrR family transcriptional regulator, partial [Anaerolineae bacterium]